MTHCNSFINTKDAVCLRGKTGILSEKLALGFGKCFYDTIKQVERLYQSISILLVNNYSSSYMDATLEDLGKFTGFHSNAIRANFVL